MSIKYIAGLFDGDGTFSVTISRHPTIPCGYQIQPVVALGLSTRDKPVFAYITNIFPELGFKIIDRKQDVSVLRLRRWKDVLLFITTIKPYIRVFTNVKRITLLEEIARIIIENMHGVHYDCKKHMPKILQLIALIRRYAKRSKYSFSNNIADIARKLNIDPKAVLPQFSTTLEEEGMRYDPPDFSWEYFAGLFDAEGYIGLIVRRHPRQRFGYQVHPIVNINMAIYDSKILYKLADKLRHLNPHIKQRRQNNTTYFQIIGVYNVKQFIEFVKPYSKLPTMRTKIELVEKAIDLIHEGAHSDHQKWSELMSIVDKLHSLSKRRNKKSAPY